MMPRFYKILFLISLFSSTTYAEFSPTKRVHSLFNSELLQEDEFLIDLVPWTSVQYGVTKNLELGTSSWMLLGRQLNFFLKHRMFTLGRNETSFTSFNIISPKTSFNDVTASGLVSLHGVVNSYHANDSWYINAGLMHGYVLWDTINRNSVLGDVHSRSQFDVYAGLVGTEYYFSKRWAFHSFVLLPLYVDINQVSDLSDGEITAFGNLKVLEKTYVINASMTRTWNVFAFEFGLLRLSTASIPYISLLWRFK